MFGDKAEEKVEKQADEIEGGAQIDAAALMASLMDGATANLMMQAMQAEEWGEEEEGGEGEDGEDGGEGEEISEGQDGDEDVEEIDADAEADHQENGQANSEQKEKEEEVEVEEEEKKSKAATGAANGSNDTNEANGQTGDDQDDEEGEEGEEEANGEQENGEPKEPELNDLELAWQVLEIARVVYSMRPDLKLELSDVHFSLGSVAFEDDKMPEAKAEFEKALKYAEEANNRRAQAQVLLLMSNISESTSTEAAVVDLERARSLMKDEIESVKDNPNVDVKALQDSLTEIDARIFALNEKFVAANPDDVKGLPDPSKGKVTFSFSEPQIDSGTGAAAASSDAPVTVLQPKKKAKPAEGIRPISLPSVAPAPLLVPVDDVSESRGQKRTANDAEATEEIYTEEPVAKRAKVAEE